MHSRNLTQKMIICDLNAFQNNAILIGVKEVSVIQDNHIFSFVFDSITINFLRIMKSINTLLGKSLGIKLSHFFSKKAYILYVVRN